jgi:plasmid stabilization system protein ParE
VVGFDDDLLGIRRWTAARNVGAAAQRLRHVVLGLALLVEAKRK